MGSENNALNHLERNRYFLSGGDGYFLAKNQLFRVHRYFLERESPVFQQWFQSGGVLGGPRNGETESTAIVLDVAPASFEKLLNVFYNEQYSVYDWSIDDWTIVVELAQKWEFRQVLELAIRELSKMDMPLISRIRLYQQLKINQKHLLPLYSKLSTRPQGLTKRESEAIGLTTTVLIFNARERLRANPSTNGLSPLPAGLDDGDAEAVLVDLLKSPHHMLNFV